MRNPDERYTTNILLDVLSPDDLALLKPHFTREKLDLKKVLVPANQPIEHVWFPEGGVASVVAEMTDNGPTEVGIFGREGFAGTPLLLGADTSPLVTFIQVNGHTGLRMKASRFLAAIDQSATLRTTLLRYIQTFITQTAHSAVSNAHQRIEARLARWLLMCHDRYDSDDIPLTHEFMAMMIAAERSGVTVSLHVLEGAGMIRSKRGRVMIRGGSGDLHSGDKWIADLTAAMLAASRRQDEQATTPESQPGVQGEGGPGRREGREDAGRAGAAV